MTDRDESVEQRLKRLTQATSALEARPDFADRVMLAIAQHSPQSTAQRGGVLEQVALSWARVLPFAATLAVVAVVLAINAEPETDDTFTADYGLVSSLDLAYGNVDNAVDEEGAQ